MDHIEFEDGGQIPSYIMHDSNSPWMVRMVIKISGNSLSEKTATYVLLVIGIVCLLAALIILRATF